ncbi:MAG: AzlC family ABC transporter permease [Pseudomonadota bacterium]
MDRASAKYFWIGFRDCLPFFLMALPFGVLFGAVATELGWNLAQTMVATILVIAGASQFTAVTLWAEGTPVLFVLITALAVNMRMAMYSAALVPHFGKASPWYRAWLAYAIVDQNFALAIQKYEAEPELTWQEKAAYFVGFFCFIAPVWISSTLIGALFGNAIPESFALDFAVPILFIAIFAPLLRSIPNIAAAFVSVVVALTLYWVPYSMGLIFAAVAAMMVGAQTEIWITKWKATHV